MTQNREWRIFTSERDGKWLAATNLSPFFCFEAESEEAVLLKTREALKFYGEAKAKIVESKRERELVVPAWRVKPSEHLIAA